MKSLKPIESISALSLTYDHLVIECKDILDKVIYPSGWTNALGHFRLGKLIMDYEQAGIIKREHGEASIAKLANDLGISTSLLYRNIGIAEELQTEEALEKWRVEYKKAHNGREPGWSQMRDILPSPTDFPHKYGGIEEVADSYMKELERYGEKIEQLQELLEKLSLDSIVREEIKGVLSKAEELRKITAPRIPNLQLSRDKDYLEFIRNKPCIVCAGNAEPHHLGEHGIGIKATDYMAVPLCHKHHTECHSGGIIKFQERYNISFPSRIIEMLILFIEGETNAN